MVAVGVVVILFALANSHKTKISLQPVFEYETPDLPFYLFILAAVFLGFVAGGLIAWISGGRARRRVRAMSRHIERLEREGEEMQQQITRLENAADRVEEAAHELEADRPHEEDRLTGV
jgi:hypothetical protein